MQQLQPSLVEMCLHGSGEPIRMDLVHGFLQNTVSKAPGVLDTSKGG